MTATHLYVHVPFCARRCTYCDFAIAVRREVPVDEYLSSLGTELNQVAPTRRGAPLQTLYLGGGTPSRLGAAGVAATIALVRERFEIVPEAEITVEANPDDVSPAAVSAWLEAGVNRVSLGVQSMDDRVLAWMHRSHDAAQAAAAARTIRKVGISNLSMDLIFALPAHLGRDWRRDLELVLDLEPDHVSLYGLTIEPATPLGRMLGRGELIAADEDAYAADFLTAHELATDRGFIHYEVSNFARPGKESRHNSAYWSGAAYVGVGPSAHSFDGLTRRWNVRAYADWVERLAEGGLATEGSETLTSDNRAAEDAYLGLRTGRGMRLAGANLAQAARWAEAGWARLEGDTVKLTPEGWLRMDSLAAGLTGA